MNNQDQSQQPRNRLADHYRPLCHGPFAGPGAFYGVWDNRRQAWAMPEYSSIGINDAEREADRRNEAERLAEHPQN